MPRKGLGATGMVTPERWCQRGMRLDPGNPDMVHKYGVVAVSGGELRVATRTAGHSPKRIGAKKHRRDVGRRCRERVAFGSFRSFFGPIQVSFDHFLDSFR